MATHTRYFSHTDTGAPTFTASLGSLCSLLKTCLVGTSGVAYGSGGSEKLAAGWSVAYEDAPAYKLALRNDSTLGTGFYLRIIDDGTGTSATAANAHVQGYSSMTDIDTGNDATPAAVAGWPGARIEKAGSAGPSAVPWAIVADERTAIVALNVNATDGKAMVYYFGDYLSYVPGFAWPWLIAAGGPSTAISERVSYLSKISQQDTNAAGVFVMRDITGSAGVVRRVFASPHGSAGNAPGCVYAPNVAISPTMVSRIITHPIRIASNYGPIGELRGLQFPSQTVVGVLTPNSLLSTTDAGSEKIMLVNSNSYGSTYTYSSGGLIVEVAKPWQQ